MRTAGPCQKYDENTKIYIDKLPIPFKSQNQKPQGTTLGG